MFKLMIYGREISPTICDFHLHMNPFPCSEKRHDGTDK